MHVGQQPSATKTRNKPSIFLMDANPDRCALRRKVMALYGVEVVGACDLAEAASTWHLDRYDIVLIDIRRDHDSCIAWRNEIKKERPQQIVPFLVGKPGYIELNPLAESYVAEEQGAQWRDSLRKAIWESCDSQPQTHGFIERIAAARKLNGTSCENTKLAKTARSSQEVAGHANEDNDRAPAVAARPNKNPSLALGQCAVESALKTNGE
jgi:hypothetical protein